MTWRITATMHESAFGNSEAAIESDLREQFERCATSEPHHRSGIDAMTDWNAEQGQGERAQRQPDGIDALEAEAAELRAANDVLAKRYIRVAGQRDAALAGLLALETRVVAVLNQHALDTCDIPNGGPDAEPEWVTELRDALGTTAAKPTEGT